MKPFAYARPSTLAEAADLLAPHPEDDGADPRILAGGTDLLTMMKEDLLAPSLLIDIKRLNDLDDRIVLEPDGLRIGALATLAEVERDPLVLATHPALAQAAGLAASPQLRNMATIGGNLLQRPRCWYFRDHEVACWLKGGSDCPAVDGENQHHALFGDSPCHAVHPSDPATALLALGASVVIRGGDGERAVSMEDFLAAPTAERRTENLLGSDEIIIAVTVPDRAETVNSVYLKAMDRKVWSFALVGVGVQLDVVAGRIEAARIAMGGVATIPMRMLQAETMLIGEAPGNSLFERAAEAALEGAAPLSRNGYKIPLAKALVRRALTAAGQLESGD